MLLNDQIVVLTGANRGIGKAILKLFYLQGASIFACTRCESSHFLAEIDNLKKGQTHHPNLGFIEPVYFDLRYADQVKEGIRTILSKTKKIDILINNAGVSSGSLFQMTSMESMKAIFEVNFFAQLLMTQTISRLMVKQKKGSIINIASISAIQAEVGTIAYGSSKAALIYATKVMAKELGSANVRVNAIAPSVTKTDMFDEMDPLAREKMINSTALKRPADSSEVANAALFLASELSSYTTGHVLTVDGGISG